MKKKAAIYHFTNESKKRPKIYKDQLKILENFTKSFGFDVEDIYCDFSLKRNEHVEFKRFLNNCENYDALVTKDFYHISKNTSMCMKIMRDLIEKGIEIRTIENGLFNWEDVAFDKPYKVATYTSQYGSFEETKQMIPIKNDVFSLFVNKKTSWKIIDHYNDHVFFRVDDEQVQLAELINNIKKYDLLLVNNMNEIHRRTAKFCKIRELMKIDIYSLQEGLLKYRKD